MRGNSLLFNESGAAGGNSLLFKWFFLTLVRLKPTMTYMNYIRPFLERRFAPRVRVEMFLMQYVRELGFRALATNLSPTGLLVQKLIEPHIPLSRVVSVEFEIPGTGEIVWARAEPRFDALGEDFHTSGLIFTGMANKHERLLSEFVFNKKFSRRYRLGEPNRL